MTSYKHVLIASCLILACSSVAMAQYQRQGQTISCSSDDGRRTYCDADTRNGVTLINQRSDAACVEGRTWGYDRRGIWVDRGCRAEFGLGRGIANGPARPGGSYPGGPASGYNRPNGRVIYSGPIINRGSEKALDVERPAGRDGATVQQWAWADQPNQTWDIYDLGNGEAAIVSQRSGYALTVQGGRDFNGAGVIQRPWNGSRQQRWRVERMNGDWSRIVSVESGKVLDVTGQSRQDGAPIQQWDWADQANQQWRLGRR